MTHIIMTTKLSLAAIPATATVLLAVKSNGIWTIHYV